MIKLEYSTDNGATFHPWVYYRENQSIAANHALQRLSGLYRETGWQFRLSPVDDSDTMALRRLLYFQGIVK